MFGATGKNAGGEEERYFGWMPIPPDTSLQPTIFKRSQARARELKEAVGLH
ncbi:hypothetical protein DB31_2903 [Hyalangium minutum]|uniref:Uncharacterized protein n=1 Tax=Hyalangium minutum TaxID=394096 RepID=A0A085W6J7_9BACT|nr:hypothetical protein DB31_2903 [Hyalangium minutum]